MPTIRVPSRFFGIRNFPFMKLVIRDFKAKSGHRDVNHHENLQGMTGLKNPMWGVM